MSKERSQSTIARQKRWANEVKKRDNYTCLICGDTKNLIAHHIKSFKKNIELRFDLRNGQTLCKKCHKDIRKPKKAKQNNTPQEWKNLTLTGEKFGEWSVLNLQIRIGRNYFYVCKCNCGNIRKVSKNNLKNGRSKSCGCLEIHAKSNKQIGENNISYKHGCSVKGKWTKEYRAWVGIKTRCYNTNSRTYDLYGGRGIKICDQWNDFEQFIKDVGIAPTSEHQLDRIDVNGNYEPNNCRWVTRQQQMRNYRNNRLLTLDNETKTVVEWSELLNINIKTIHSRKRYGWSDAKTLTEAVK